MRVYLGPDNVPAPSELAQYRNAGSPRPVVPAHAAPRQPLPVAQPVTAPAATRFVGEDNSNWENLSVLGGELEDVIIELD